jgi:hypothetical protein
MLNSAIASAGQPNHGQISRQRGKGLAASTDELPQSFDQVQIGRIRRQGQQRDS